MTWSRSTTWPTRSSPWPVARGTAYNLAAGKRASSVGELIELGSELADRPPPRILPPTLYRRAIHPILVRRGSERRRRALRRSEVFFPYFEMRVRYDVGQAREALQPLGIEVPRLPCYFDRLMEFAHWAQWGKRSVARHEVAPTPAFPTADAPGPARTRRE